jgi:hypothetical protein
MLNQDERDFIEAQLLHLVVSVATPRQVIVAGLYANLAAELTEGLPPTALIRKAVDLCIQDAYSQSPAALVQLLETLLRDIPRIIEIVDRIRTPPPPPPDPFEALILNTKLPFLDRRPARTYLRAFLQQRPQQPIIVVNGTPKSGKSYTVEFIDHLTRSLEKVQHCRVELASQQGASTGARELASDIVTNVGGDPQKVPPRDTNVERWTQELANWVIAEAMKSEFRWWFVLDGFNAQELRDDTRMLIVKLAKGLTNGVARLRHRLILLDFDRSLLPVQPGMIAAETTGTGIPQSSVTAAITQILQASNKTFNLAAVTAKVTEGFADPVLDLPELGSRLQDLIALAE